MCYPFIVFYSNYIIGFSHKQVFICLLVELYILLQFSKRTDDYLKITCSFYIIIKKEKNVEVVILTSNKSNI